MQLGDLAKELLSRLNQIFGLNLYPDPVDSWFVVTAIDQCLCCMERRHSNNWLRAVAEASTSARDFLACVQNEKESGEWCPDCGASRLQVTEEGWTECLECELQWASSTSVPGPDRNVKVTR